MNQQDVYETLIKVMQTLAVIESRMAVMDNLDKRLREVETTLTRIQATTQAQRPKAPWWAVVGAVVGIVGAVGTVVGLFVILIQITNALDGRL